VKNRQVCISMNNKGGHYFKNYEGLRQGDSVSPFVFNVVSDGLAARMRKAQHNGLVEGLITSPSNTKRDCSVSAIRWF
jgi:hypothetical protein